MHDRRDRRPAKNQTTRNNMLAYDLTTGALKTAFNPNLNGQALAVAASPDGSRIYVGGEFTSVAVCRAPGSLHLTRPPGR